MIYAVNKRTKEHRVVYPDANGKHRASMGERLVQADPDGWIERQGRECPLPNDAWVQVKMRDLDVTTGTPGRSGWLWGCYGERDDIIAYRPILDADTKPCRFHDDDAEACETYSGQVPCEPEPPAWDGEGKPPVGCECEVSIDGDSHVGGRVIAYHEDMVWIDLGGRHPVRLTDRCHFRPIRSEEDCAIDEMVELFDVESGYSFSGLCRALCRAGYRKTGGEG